MGQSGFFMTRVSFVTGAAVTDDDGVAAGRMGHVHSRWGAS